MLTDVPGKVLKIANQIAAEGHANVTRLTILKKWFRRPSRLKAFAIWVATRAAAQPGKTNRAAAPLFKAARRLLRGQDKLRPDIDRQQTQQLFHTLSDFQNEHVKQRWGSIRSIKNWNLFVVEKALCVYLWHADTSAAGYEIAAVYFRPYDGGGYDLSKGPHVAKLKELARFMVWVEKREDQEM